VSARLQDLGASFARHLRAEGKADRTIKLYLMSVDFYSRWLEGQGRTATLDELDKAAIREWLAQLTDTHAPGTVRTRYRGLRRFCGWLVAEDEIPANPMANLSPPVPKPKPVPVLSDEQLADLIKTCAGKGHNERRDEAVLRMLMDTGIRVSELCGLRVDDVDLDQGQALTRGKGNKVRMVYPSARTVQALDRYLRVRSAHRWAHRAEVFLTQRGAMSPDGARERVRIRGEQAGIEGLHPHAFRHLFAHDYLMAGGGERDLMRLAGWTSPEMLSRYGASAADARAKAAAQRMKRGDRV
jgi:site-specific recombinase XerD